MYRRINECRDKHFYVVSPSRPNSVSRVYFRTSRAVGIHADFSASSYPSDRTEPSTSRRFASGGRCRSPGISPQSQKTTTKRVSFLLWRSLWRSVLVIPRFIANPYAHQHALSRSRCGSARSTSSPTWISARPTPKSSSTATHVTASSMALRFLGVGTPHSAGIMDVMPRILRYTFATRLIENGADLHITQSRICLKMKSERRRSCRTCCTARAASSVLGNSWYCVRPTMVNMLTVRS